MVKTLKGSGGQAPDTTEAAVRDYTINQDGTVTIHMGHGYDYAVDFGEFIMAYAPMSLITKIAEPI